MEGVSFMRTLPSEYSSGDCQTHEARQTFLSEVERTTPEVLADLRAFVWPLVNDHARLGVELKEWADIYNLAYPWAIEQARATLALWSSGASPLSWGVLSFGTGAHLPTLPAARPFNVEWNPHLETEAEARRRLRAEFENRLQEHFSTTATTAEACGLTRSPTERATADGGRQAMRLFCLYHVRRWSIDRIARHDGISGEWTSTDFLRKAIYRAAETLDIPMRGHNERGRPRKKGGTFAG